MELLHSLFGLMLAGLGMSVLWPPVFFMAESEVRLVYPGAALRYLGSSGDKEGLEVE